MERSFQFGDSGRDGSIVARPMVSPMVMAFHEKSNDRRTWAISTGFGTGVFASCLQAWNFGELGEIDVENSAGNILEWNGCNAARDGGAGSVQ
jgi:hypothetical protein